MPATLEPNEIDIDSFENPFLTSMEGRPDDSGNAAPGTASDAESLPPGDEAPLPSGDVKGNQGVASTPGVTSTPDDEDEADAPQEADPFDLSSAFGTREEKKKANKGLREQLRDRNKVIEDMQAQIEERENRLKELRTQQEELAKEREEYQRALSSKYEIGEYSPTSDPEVRKLDQELVSTIREAEVNLGEAGGKFAQHWESLLNGYQNAINGKDADKFRKLVDENFDEMAPQVRQELKSLNRLITQRSQTINANRGKHFETVIGSYDQKVNEAKQLVAQIGAMPKEEMRDISDLNTIITFAASGDETYREEVERVKRAAVAFSAGVRPFDIRDAKWRPYLDSADPTRLSQEGERLRQQEVYQYEAAQKQLPKRLAEMWSASLLVPKLVKRLTELSARLGEDQENELEPKIASEEAPEPKDAASKIDLDDLDDPDKLKNPYLPKF